MSTIFEADASDHLCPYNQFEPCYGKRCMAWASEGPTEDRCETDNLVDTPEGPRPVGAPPTPEGDGWEMSGPASTKSYHRSEKDKLPKASSQRWVRPRAVVRGFCGRTSRDNEYGW